MRVRYTCTLHLMSTVLVDQHFRHLIEGRQFSICTKHKTLTYMYTLLTSSDKYTLRQIRHLVSFHNLPLIYAMLRVLKMVQQMHYLAYMQMHYM